MHARPRPDAWRLQFTTRVAVLLLIVGTGNLSRPAFADQAELAAALRELSADAFGESKREELAGMVRDDLRARIQQANDQSTAAWGKITGRQDWERFRDRSLQALRDSLGSFPKPAKTPTVRVTGTLNGEGYRVEKLVFESRPGLWVTAHLYSPVEPPKSMPGILISHSHHRPKQQDELQDMGATWARAGCVVLVPDHLGHGERRQHSFRSSDDYQGDFAVSRQDYYFRYDTGMQLHLVGDSLIGWMAWDLMRGVDVLLSRPGVDPDRIILLGGVAGGGDPAGVTGALDDRIDAVVPFNFGGPQPETRFPLPEDAETSFNYFGGGGWESTRNLRHSCSGGFPHWVIVGGIAPRRLVYGHEFSWDEPRDPVWKRLQKIYGWHDAEARLGVAHGGGLLRVRSPEATHCGNIGKVHRKMIHPYFRRWFDMTTTTESEYSRPRETSELTCMTPAAKKELRPRRLVDILPELAKEREAAAEKRRAGKSPSQVRDLLRSEWTRILGDPAPADSVQAKIISRETIPSSKVRVERIALTVQRGLTVPVLLLTPATAEKPAPVVVLAAHAGKAKLLDARSAEIAELLQGGAAVCLPDARGTGETKPDNDRGRYSADTSRSSSELMLGGTMVGARVGDLRSVLKYLRSRKDLDSKRVALWGDSLAPVNGPETNFRMPRRVDGLPRGPEPLGGLLAMFTALFEDDVKAIRVHGGLTKFSTALESQLLPLPHDAVVPGVSLVGDLPPVAAALAPRPLRIESAVDALNRRQSTTQLNNVYAPVAASYRSAGVPNAFSAGKNPTPPAKWILAQLNDE
ncbi:MAG: acetylxylan esterase [Planctomycetales bacterium]